MDRKTTWKKKRKKFQKGVDKSEDMRYTKQAGAESGREHWKLHSVEIWVKINFDQKKLKAIPENGCKSFRQFLKTVIRIKN